MSSNRLSETTSPYLLQHADNPVDWQPWDEAALNLARRSNRPILLSIGYSACHWCHVMAHESFEDDATAELMNRLFVNIKVDREERPDLDRIYQAAYQLMHQRGGGWPLTVFLTPDDHVPFFTGTYFPPVGAFGRPSFQEVLTAVDEAWQTREQDIRQQNKMMIDALSTVSPVPKYSTLTAVPIDKANEILARAFHSPKGGFSKAPKFPHPDMLNQCLLAWHDSEDASVQSRALEMAQTTALHMALGGINDQLGGGFCRYSTDVDWMIPHFEKMLYDNGPLLSFYTDLYQITGNKIYEQTVRLTADWVAREMQSETGGYFSALDADSEGEEGKFYVWDREEVRQLLTEDEFHLVADRFSLNQEANFEGRWHLHCDAQRFDQPLTGPQQAIWESARKKLFVRRQQRVRPGTDDKILTSWNALMIKGMVKASVMLDEKGWFDSALRAIKFIHENLWIDGRLLAAHREGVSHLSAYLDDYAYLIDAILELLQANWDSAYLEFAQQLADVLLEHFQDDENGGFFFTGNEHESLIQRPKPFSDEAMPAGNGIAARVLMRLGYLCGNTAYLQAGEKTLLAAWQDIQTYPHAHCSLLYALQEYLKPPQTIIIRGKAEQLKTWHDSLLEKWHPHRQVFAIDEQVSQLSPSLQAKSSMDKTCAYVCEGMTCLPPVTAIENLP